MIRSLIIGGGSLSGAEKQRRISSKILNTQPWLFIRPLLVGGVRGLATLPPTTASKQQQIGKRVDLEASSVFSLPQVSPESSETKKTEKIVCLLLHY